MRTLQGRAFVKQNIDFDPDAVARVTVVDGGAREAEDVFETGGCPVVDDEEGEEAGAEGVQPPEVGGLADVGEDQGEGVEDYVGFAI
ncbi:hypothetical protein CJF30_00008878 [Rutstroemia sp. NJR-2017a BBW]|nr:hypothetical protein CJF30_00008878 [Rutstroemia sp. NJR-2017a BBW]